MRKIKNPELRKLMKDVNKSIEQNRRESERQQKHQEEILDEATEMIDNAEEQPLKTAGISTVLGSYKDLDDVIKLLNAIYNKKPFDVLDFEVKWIKTSGKMKREEIELRKLRKGR